MKISVAMCTYNGSRYLLEQLESIANQSRPPDEVVICDDRSSDATAEIARTFASSAPFPVRILINDENLGSTRNFEKCMALCEGDIVALSDQDDIWHPSKLHLIEKAFMEDPLLGLVFSDARLVDEKLRPLGHTLWSTVLFTKEKQERFERGGGFPLLVSRNIVTGATAAYRRTLNEVLLPFPALSGAWIHDGWIALVATAVSNVKPIAICLVDYRQHPLQQLGAPKTWKSLVRSILPRDDLERQVQDLTRIRERLTAAPIPVLSEAEKHLHVMAARIKHLEMRIALPRRRIQKIRPIWMLLRRGYYHRYSSGWMSAARDLIGL